jgi:Trk K+ transport system NAD-binding subunit
MILVAAGHPDAMRKLGELVRPITHDGPIVVIGLSEVARKIAEFLRECGEQVCTIASQAREGIDIVGDLLDEPVLERADIANARVAILALESDSAATLAAAMVRDQTADIPIIASVATVENVERIQQAGADFALSVSQVSGHILAHHVLSETVSHQPRMKLVKLAPGALAGLNPHEARIREHTGCTVVAIERGSDLIMDFDESFTLAASDALHVCGTNNALVRYHERFPGARL